MPLNSGIVPSFKEREIAFGTSWRNRTQGGNAIVIALDFSDLSFNPKDDYTIHSQIYGLSLGYAF